jgi:hypothetical protein
VGALCLAMAGCAPALYGGQPGNAVSVAGPTCELSATDRNVATVECREADAWEMGPVRERARVPIAPRSRPLAMRRAGFDAADDDLAPDPFAEAPAKESLAYGTTGEDDLAPDPFFNPVSGRFGARHDHRVHRSQQLAEDDLAPDPFSGPVSDRFVERRPATSSLKNRPLAEDELAPDPFARAER